MAENVIQPLLEEMIEKAVLPKPDKPIEISWHDNQPQRSIDIERNTVADG